MGRQLFGEPTSRRRRRCQPRHDGDRGERSPVDFDALRDTITDVLTGAGRDAGACHRAGAPRAHRHHRATCRATAHSGAIARTRRRCDDQSVELIRATVRVCHVSCDG